MGDARVVREATKDAEGKDLPRMEFRGEFLHSYVKEERVKSHLPVVLTRGADRFTGDEFAFNNLTGVADLKGRVRGILYPKAAASSAAARDNPRPRAPIHSNKGTAAPTRAPASGTKMSAKQTENSPKRRSPRGRSSRPSTDVANHSTPWEMTAASA